MAKFINIPVTAQAPGVLLNVDNITSVVILAASATAVSIYSGAKVYPFIFTSAANATLGLAAINNAILTVQGPTLAPVVFPAGVAVALSPVVA